MHRKIQVEKTRLIENLRTNRERHLKDHKAAVEDWNKLVTASVLELSEAEEAPIQLGEELQELVSLLTTHKPFDNTSAYDDALEVLNWTVGDTVELEKHEFDQYVKDEWHWKAGYTTNAVYLSTRAEDL